MGSVKRCNTFNTNNVGTVARFNAQNEATPGNLYLIHYTSKFVCLITAGPIYRMVDAQLKSWALHNITCKHNLLK